MTETSGNRPRTDRIFHALMVCYPRPFRREYGSAMAEMFSARREQSGRGVVSSTLFITREFASLGIRV